jgi:hypothetical protein
MTIASQTRHLIDDVNYSVLHPALYQSPSKMRQPIMKRAS